MLGRAKEGPPLYGDRYVKYQEAVKRLEELGPKQIQKEINELWEEITLRTELLSQYQK